MPINRIKGDEKIEIHIRHPLTNESIRIYDFAEQMDIEDMNMMKAKVEYKNGDVFYICFRNPQNLSLYQIRKENLFVGLARHGELNALKYGKYNYFGTISYDKKQKKNPYSIISPKKDEIEYVRKNMDTQLEIWEQKQKQEFRESLKITEDSKNLLKEYFDKKQKNIDNPFLRKSKLINEEGIEEEIYEGVDLTTGDFIVLKDLQCEEIDEKYIYSGYLNYIDTIEEKNTRTKSELESYEVIFELPYTIDGAIEDQNINSVLKLLSKSESLLKKYRLNMLGKIQENGKLRRPPYKASEEIFNYYKQKARNIYEKYKSEKGKEKE